jgi:ribosomal protein S27AE
MRFLSISGPGVATDEEFCPNCHVKLDQHEHGKACPLCHYEVRQLGQAQRLRRRRY